MKSFILAGVLMVSTFANAALIELQGTGTSNKNGTWQISGTATGADPILDSALVLRVAKDGFTAAVPPHIEVPMNECKNGGIFIVESGPGDIFQPLAAKNQTFPPVVVQFTCAQ